ncbi:hypothetical protein HPMG_00559 [Helicobacter pullorum MIT 98-5489]|uniref:Uncharacterized protein n=1 Tax=Helicobacter pullorum MIT 98-5489 TaxID=537972 RepID=C5EYY7_9HELI|nr:hypothetical protein HPMG_00559 [Helicobacter pullorum MIT 98-5489]
MKYKNIIHFKFATIAQTKSKYNKVINAKKYTQKSYCPFKYGGSKLP